MMTLLERFEQKYIPEPNSGCFLWIGTSNNRTSKSKEKDCLPSQYGLMRFSNPSREEYAHRVSWELHRGKIPFGMCVLHRCDQPCCVNPDHLFLGTIADNNKDTASKGRNRYALLKGMKNGSAKLTNNMVREIRCSSESSRQLARRFGVGHVAILKIKSGKTWKHLQ